MPASYLGQILQTYSRQIVKQEVSGGYRDEMIICILDAETPRYLYQLGPQILAARHATSKKEIRT